MNEKEYQKQQKKQDTTYYNIGTQKRKERQRKSAKSQPPESSRSRLRRVESRSGAEKMLSQTTSGTTFCHGNYEAYKLSWRW